VDTQVHFGYDLASTKHSPVPAANSGVVAFAGPLTIYGNTVIVDHGLGLQTLYAHLSSIEAKVGDKVTKGQELGRSGATGPAVGTLFSVPTSRSQRSSTSCATRRGTTTTPSRSPTTISPRLTRTPPSVSGWPQSVTRQRGTES